ncbi:hypothetical protein [Xenorhabdus bovienii]|uniref:hypothetical protein n=1 Tax=Xenorhabdus bovienii TaxID=40576 RepID=UPI003DA1E544
MMNIFKPNRRLSLAEQYHGLRARYPNGKCRIKNKNKTLTWHGVIAPTPFSRQYEVLINYTPNSTPDCTVLSPDLKTLAKGKNIPHIYASDMTTKGTQLCLFLPRTIHPENFGEWRPQLMLSETILPWASLWLFYFEQWLYSGIWEGGGAHPNGDDMGVYFDE